MCDEMKLNRHIDYSVQEDKVLGYSEWGDKVVTEKKIADHALVYMIKNMDGWKFPIAYRFVQGTFATPDLASGIKEVILLLKECGFNTVGTVCDQGSTNQAAVHALVKETDKIRHKLNCSKRWFIFFFYVVLPFSFFFITSTFAVSV